MISKRKRLLLLIVMVLLGCQMAQKIAESTGSSTEVATVPNDPTLPIVCGNEGELVAHSFVALEQLPPDFRIGLPEDLTQEPYLAAPEGFRIESCFREGVPAVLKRISWRGYNPTTIWSIIPDTTIEAFEDHTYRIGDVSHGVYRIPSADAIVENLDEALFGDHGTLKIELSYQQHQRTYKIQILGHTTQRGPIVRFLSSFSGDNEPVRYMLFYVGGMDLGDPFRRSEDGCTPNWERKSHKWDLDGEVLTLDLCWIDTGSSLAGFTRNYYPVKFGFDGHVTTSTEDPVQIASHVRLQVEHHNFYDCAVITTPARTYIVSLRAGLIHSCGIEGDPIERMEDFEGYRFAVLKDDSWHIATALVFEDEPYGPWPLEQPIHFHGPQAPF